MNNEQRKAVSSALECMGSIDDTDHGQVMYRVARRQLAEALGLPVENYMLLRDRKETVKPIYCPSQYINK